MRKKRIQPIVYRSAELSEEVFVAFKLGSAEPISDFIMRKGFPFHMVYESQRIRNDN